jgi:hypothetical protein
MTITKKYKRLLDLCLKISFVHLDVFFSYLTYYHNLVVAHQISHDQNFITYQKTFGQLYYSHSKIKKDSSMLIGFEETSTYLIMKDICSWWLVSEVQSSITEKYFDCLIILMISVLIVETSKRINLYVMLKKVNIITCNVFKMFLDNWFKSR